jgi:hypothetical protein
VQRTVKSGALHDATIGRNVTPEQGNNLMGTGAAAGLSLASAGLSAYGSIVKGQGEQAADEYKAQSLERAAESGKVKATQASGMYTENLNRTLGNIDAVRAAAHDDPTSPTGAAIRDTAEYQGERQKTITVDNILEQAERDAADAAYMRSAGKYALLSGKIGAGANILNALGMTDWTKFGFGKSGGGGSPSGQSGSAGAIY